ncbi:MAG: hypothetical protein SGARI_004715, partial [Bacillariaceae sp.]
AAAAAVSTNDTKGNDDDNEEEEGEVTEKPLANPNSTAVVAFECQNARAFVRATDKKTGKQVRDYFASGGLKLERDNTTGTSQIVIRDAATGIVKYQLAVSKDMRLDKAAAPKSGKVSVSMYGPVNGQPKLLYLQSDDKNLEFFDALVKFKNEAS